MTPTDLSNLMKVYEAFFDRTWTIAKNGKYYPDFGRWSFKYDTALAGFAFCSDGNMYDYSNVMKYDYTQCISLPHLLNSVKIESYILTDLTKSQAKEIIENTIKTVLGLEKVVSYFERKALLEDL